MSEQSGQRLTAREQLQSQMLERASRNREFRNQLLQDPKKALAQIFDVQIPESITVEVVEESPTKFYLVLPPASEEVGQELTDQDLAAAATGSGKVVFTEAHTAFCGPSCNPICSGG